MTEKDLHDYQRRAIDFILSKKRVGLFIDMGLGKTISTLTAIDKLLYGEFTINKVLIIAPLRVCNTVWEQEARKWKHTKHISFTNLSGGKKNMVAGLMEKSDVYLINRENVVLLVDYLGSKWDFDMIVIDESSSFKSHSTRRFRAMKKVVFKTDYMVLLTGTPSPNSYMDLWPQLYLIDGGKRLYSTISKYRARWFDKDHMGFKYELRQGADKQIQERIKDICLSMKAEDYIELPQKINVVTHQPLEGKLLREYNKLKKEMVLMLEDEKEITAMTAATLTNKLLQFCSGNIYDESGEYIHIHDHKIEMFKEIIEDNPNESFLVAYNYKHELEHLLKHFKGAEVLGKDEEVVNRWNKGKVKILLAHPASAGHGLNLQHGGSIIVWYGFTWSLELYQQFNARLHRQGQDKSVRIIHLAVGEVENKLMETLTHKDVSQRELLKALT